jgi:hypothetical protein
VVARVPLTGLTADLDVPTGDRGDGGQFAAVG